MPIYAYKCESCGHGQDVLQKLSDPVLTTCPACGAERFSKQITAAGFQLKGSGWYATDFKQNGSAPPKKGGESAPSGEPAAPAPAPSPAAPAATAKAPEGGSTPAAGSSA